MSLPDIRLYVMNGSTLGVTTFTQIEDWLKIILLIVTIGYTIAKWSKVKDEENKSSSSVSNSDQVTKELKF